MRQMLSAFFSSCGQGLLIPQFRLCLGHCRDGLVACRACSACSSRGDATHEWHFSAAGGGLPETATRADGCNREGRTGAPDTIAGAVAVPPSYGAAERARRSCKPTVAADPCKYPFITAIYRCAARARRGGAGPRGGTRYACLARGAPAPNRSSTCVLRLGRLAAVC